jgi:E3 ubiquitin-protein ligase RNF5
MPREEKLQLLWGWGGWRKTGVATLSVFEIEKYEACNRRLIVRMSQSDRHYSSAYSFVPGRASIQDPASTNSGLRQRIPNIRIVDDVRPSSASAGGKLPRSSSPAPVPSDAKFTCRICLDVPEQPVVTVCGHLFCWNCVYRWIDRNKAAPQCPVCRAAIELPDGSPQRARVIPLYVDTSMEGKDPRSNIPPRPQAERPEAPHPADAPNFLNGLFGFHGDGGRALNFSVGLGLFPGLFFNFNLGNTIFGGVGGGNQQNAEVSQTTGFINRLIYSLALFVMFIIFMM